MTAMAVEIRVEAPDRDTAEELARSARASFLVDVAGARGQHEVRLRASRETNRVVAEALTLIERWLGHARLAATPVHIGDKRYLMTPPREER